MPVSQKLATAAPSDLKNKTSIRSQGSQISARKQQLADERNAKKRKADFKARLSTGKSASSGPPDSSDVAAAAPTMMMLEEDSEDD